MMQAANGPCSLLALVNLLSLEGKIHLKRGELGETVDFAYLVGILADYLVDRLADHKGESTLDLAVLNSTRTGINLNPRFTRGVEGFVPSPELALFQGAGVKLVHGWLVDPSEEETYLALQNESYDSAVLRVVEGQILSGNETGGEAEMLRAVDERSKWTAEQEGTVQTG